MLPVRYTAIFIAAFLVMIGFAVLGYYAAYMMLLLIARGALEAGIVSDIPYLLGVMVTFCFFGTTSCLTYFKARNALSQYGVWKGSAYYAALLFLAGGFLKSFFNFASIPFFFMDEYLAYVVLAVLAGLIARMAYLYAHRLIARLKEGPHAKTIAVF